MGANEKHAATYHGVSHNPDTDLVRTVYAGASPVPSYEDRETAFTRWLETVRAEAKWDALMETATVLERLDDDVEMYDENMRATPVTVWLRARADQYKETP